MLTVVHHTAFLLDLMAGQAWSRWMYDEFRPLQDLSTGQVSAYVLAARPALLPPVAERLARQGRLDDWLRELGPEDTQIGRAHV